MSSRIFLSIFISLCTLLILVECQETGQNKNAGIPPPVDIKSQDSQNSQNRGDQGNPRPEPGGCLSSSAVDVGDIINLALHPDCEMDVNRLCHDFPLKKNSDSMNIQAMNSLDVMGCFLNHEDQKISAKCHQTLWAFKKNITNDERISTIAKQQCEEDFNGEEMEISRCRTFRKEPGRFISCIIEYKDLIKNPNCISFINKVAVVVFSDYHLIGLFAEACENDIQRLQCGFTDKMGQVGHSQGATIACIVQRMQRQQQLKMANDDNAKAELARIGELSPDCAHQTMRLMELQADDFHLDRDLFFACREDRETFCHNIQSGQGKVYQCLLQNVNQERMSKECKERLERREVAAQTDYKIDYGIRQACEEEIVKYKCGDMPKDMQQGALGLSYLIICLEGPLHQDPSAQKSFHPQCLQAMHYHRQAMMSNHNLSPNIVVFCKSDIEQHCSKDVHPTAIIHCLMGVAQEKQQTGSGKEMQLESKLSPICNRELEQLIRVADPAGDPKVDVVLWEACGNIIQTRCGGGLHSPTSHIMGCLMNNMHAVEMSAACEKRLLETHYFVVRDFRLDVELYESCRDEVIRVCNLDENWSPTKKDQKPESGPLVFSCLYRHAMGLGDADKNWLSPKCEEQVKATLHQRAKAMDLPPEVDVTCIHDLAYFCANRELARGSEMNCLQDHFKELQQECRAAVMHYSEAQNKDIKLSTTYHNCLPMLIKYCHTLNPQSTLDDAMDCLIPQKNEPKMTEKCRAEIEHYQLVSITEYNLNFRFKASCKADVETFCNDPANKDVREAVFCLSSVNREDIVSGTEKPRVSENCRMELRYELLTLTEKIDFDPTIAEACKSDIEKVCPKSVIPNGNILECLRRKSKEELSKNCYAELFKLEKIQAADEFSDFSLIKACRRMIEKFCPDSEGYDLLPCLIERKKEPAMDPKCRKMIITRQVEEAKDVRLNPSFLTKCNFDLHEFCKHDLEELEKNDVDAPEAEEKLLKCLKANRKNLKDDCKNELVEVAKEVTLDYRMDPHLVNACKDNIVQCPRSQDDTEEKGEVVECLKKQLREHKLNSMCAVLVSGLVADGKADVHVDSILYSACQLDMRRLCFRIQPGESRQFQCLVDALHAGYSLNVDCQKKLKDREDLVTSASERCLQNFQRSLPHVVVILILINLT